MDLGPKSSDGLNPSQSDIFPEKYIQCSQQFSYIVVGENA